MGIPLRLLLIEDSEDDALLLLRELRRGGFEPSCRRIYSRAAFEVELDNSEWDLIISDYTLPHFSGADALKIFRSRQLDIPFIIVTGTIGEDVAVGMMKAGVHDYLMKDNLARLVPAIQRELTEARVRREQRLSERALQQSEAEYRRIVETSSEGIWVMDREQITTYVNQRMADMLGLKIDDMIGHHVSEFVFPDELNAHEARMNERKNGRSGRYEQRFRHANGTVVWCLVSATAMMDDNGQFRGSFGMFTDITERIEMEEALKESERRFRDMMENVHLLALILDTEEKIVFCNDFLLHLTGWQRNEVIGRNWFELFLPKEDNSRQILAEAMARGEIPAHRENPILTRSGEQRLVTWNNTLMRDASGRVSGYASIGEDITERKRAIDLITQAKSEWEATFDAVEDLVVISRADGSIQRCNRSVLSSFSCDDDAIIDKPVTQVFFGEHNTDVDFAHLSGEIQFPRLDGFFEISTYPIKSPDLEGWHVHVIKDITLRKQIESSMLTSQRLADLGTLAAGVMHDIKSPLQVIVGLSEGLLRSIERNTLEADELVRRLTMINKNGWRIEEVMRVLLTYARDVENEAQAEDLNQIISDTLLLLEHQLTVWANVKVVTALAPELPPLRCERNSISQALVNLIINARDAMPSGGTLTIRTRHNTANEELMLEVDDTGSGVPPEIQERIFEPFFTTKPADKGTGLGLAHVKKIVETNGGYITLGSKPGKGACFSLHFPALKG